jgi:phosphatidylglycerol:prolipoprotein diacylglycerol transferase
VTGVLTLSVLSFPEFDPIAIQIGPIAIRWYALAYITGLAVGWQFIRRLAARGASGLNRAQIDDLLFWVAMGVILGGRLGYVLFYRPDHYLFNPLEILKVWQGGMSFHGGMLGVIVAIIWFSRRNKLPVLGVGDTVAVAVPIGLFFGRIANFVNGELYGRASNAPWAMVFPDGGLIPRHPSQLYEAGLEGLVLFLVLAWLAYRTSALRRPGLTTGVFLVGYGLARGIIELYREPDVGIALPDIGVTMGQLLSLPMLIIGLLLISHARSHPPLDSK